MPKTLCIWGRVRGSCPGHFQGTGTKACLVQAVTEPRCGVQLQGHLGITALACVQVTGAEELFSGILETDFRPLGNVVSRGRSHPANVIRI